MKTVKLIEFEVMEDRGFNLISDLPHCTNNGIEYHIGYNDKTAAVVAMIQDEENYFIEKSELREMSLTAKVKGIERVILYTNYGLELHSKHEKPNCVGFDKIIVLSDSLSNLAVL